MTQAKPKDVQSVLHDRYWLTEKGEQAVAAYRATHQPAAAEETTP